MRASRWVVVAAVCGAFGPAQATLLWQAETSPPNHAGAQGHAAHGMARRPAIHLVDGDAAAAELWLPNLERQALEIRDGKAIIKPSGLDNYHLMLAVREDVARHESALRYHYLNGKPSRRSPSELIGADKVPLEIVPVPLTREHQRYQSGSAWSFRVRYRGQWLADQPISLETSNGTRWFTRTAGDGGISFVLPEDFPHVAVGRENNPPAEFFLHTRLHDAGREYFTTMSAAYYVNPDHWQSFRGGLWSGVAGFVVGLGLLGVLGRQQAATKKGGKGTVS